MKADKTTKWFGRLTAKTIEVTESATSKTLEAIKNTPSKTANASKLAASGFAEGYRSVRPKKENSAASEDSPVVDIVDQDLWEDLSDEG